MKRFDRFIKKTQFGSLVDYEDPKVKTFIQAYENANFQLNCGNAINNGVQNEARDEDRLRAFQIHSSSRNSGNVSRGFRQFLSRLRMPIFHF